ncbi:heat shock factor protein 5 isoform X1 [Siniperca chuatsi]|uniref:heat shock factor protein 5 isoform X1 n=1 Tax=Siniperca chuatsi TaxID=119488 RepID=UPI001CE172A6|nr:heat shock factor protein 5 isoform X1 [Siniperca chuatsi]
MDIGESSLPASINHNNFPAKLWRLVNNPANKAICWDSFGEVIIIDQHLFERQILSPSTTTLDNADAFKTTNFSSFVRQLNLYGFRKADPAVKDNPTGDSGAYHHFHNPNFKRNHPELVASLRRLTVDNKAKLQAGLNVNCRPPSRYQRFSGDDDGRDKNVKRGRSSLRSPTHQESTHPYYPNKGQAMTAHNGTPVPPRYLIRGHGAALSPTVFGTEKGIPVSLSHHYAGVASSSSAVHIQQGLLARANHGNPNVPSFNPPNAQYQPGYYSPVCQCYHPNLVASHMTGSGLQTGLFSPHSYYQASYPVNMVCRGDHNQDLESKENQEVKKCDINLDTIFQIADEVMQTPANSYLVRVATPEKPSPVLVPSSNTCNTMFCDNPASTTKANPLCVGPIIMAVSGNPNLVTYEQQEESVVFVPEQMPEDAIFEVTSDDAKDTEVIGVEVSDTLRDTSQAYNSSCTGSKPDH